MYHFNNFHFRKNEGVNDWAVEEAHPKIDQKCLENSQNVNFNIALKQFEKFYQGRGFFDCHP